MMPKKAQLTVYLQALGAHFLGAHAYEVNNIKIKLIYSGGSLHIPYNVTENFTDDGNPSTVFTAGASTFMPIITVPQSPAEQNASVHFLSPDFSTACGRTEFEMPGKMEQARLDISVPSSSGAPIQMQYPLLINPAQPVYQVTVPVPGLYLSPVSTKKTLSVFVKMMCGCPVTMGPPASLWPADDFTVFANVLDSTGKTTSYPLTYATAQSGNSLFSATLPASQKTVKSVTFTAIQKSTGNYGAVAAN